MLLGLFKSRLNPSDLFVPDQDDDVEYLLPRGTGKRHEHVQRVKHSVSYLVITCAASFTLVMMVWLGPGLGTHDLQGISSQVQAPIGYSGLASNDTAVLQSSNSSTPSASSNQSLVPLPYHSWNPLLNDPAPITHVYVKPCAFPPWLMVTLCTPSQTAKDIALFGKWVRVPRDLSKGVGHYYTEIYYRRAQTLDVSQLGIPPVTGLRVWEDAELEQPEVKAEIAKDGWEAAGEDLRTGIWPAKAAPARLWITRSASFSGHENVKPINELNVIWGNVSEAQPWWGFERILGNPVFDRNNEMDHVRCDIVARREIIPPIPTPELNFGSDGKFKILQISDLHFSATGGKCQSASLLPSCAEVGADASTVAWLSSTIDDTKPDLIVLTGDQLRGNGQNFDTLATLTKIGHLFAGKKTPWTLVFGNHDHDKSLAIEEQMYVLKHVPYFLGQAGPGVSGFPEENNSPVPYKDMGAGNYVLKVKASKTDTTQALTLYFLDSHAYSPMSLAQLWEVAMGGSVKSDCIKESQMSWYRNQSALQPQLMRPYRPAPNPSTTLNRTSKKPTALMFFHIPLPEAYATADKNPENGAELLYGNQREGPLAPENDKGFFNKAILNTTDGTSDTEVKAILTGHAHLTDTCRRHQGVWHCMSGVSSYSGRAQEAWERRIRVLEVENWGEKIETYEIRDQRAVSIKDQVASARSGVVVLYDTQSLVH